MAERSDGCSGKTLLALCTKKKRLERKMTKDYYWIGVQENIGMFSCPCLKGQLGLHSLNCHTRAMTGNCSAS